MKAQRSNLVPHLHRVTTLSHSDRRSPPPPDDSDSAGAKAQRLGFAAVIHAALAGDFVGGDDVARHIGVIIGAHQFPLGLVFGGVPGFELHSGNPKKVRLTWTGVPRNELH